MSTIGTQLYEGELVRLGPIDHEKDPPLIARWTRDPFAGYYLPEIFFRPLSVDAVRKMLERVEKAMEDSKNIFHFTLRAKTDDRLVGLARLDCIDFHNGVSRLSLGIGEETDRGHGYGNDAMQLMLRFAFQELNLHRITIAFSELHLPLMRMVEKAGFEEEVRRRKAAFHDGSYWDVINMGLLRQKWESKL